MATSSADVRPLTQPAEVAVRGAESTQRVALPLHIQMLQKALRMDRVFDEFDQLFKDHPDIQ